VRGRGEAKAQARLLHAIHTTSSCEVAKPVNVPDAARASTFHGRPRRPKPRGKEEPVCFN
jgi:hypothetical protein